MSDTTTMDRALVDPTHILFKEHKMDIVKLIHQVMKTLTHNYKEAIVDYHMFKELNRASTL